MPKVEIDYSNTIIYKIICKDPSVTHLYVGHTTNFVQRKYAHKQTCNNSKSPYYNLKLYKIIRENGNWSNWDMSIINFYNCKNNLEARQKEQEQFISLNATLNSLTPFSLLLNIHEPIEPIIDTVQILHTVIDLTTPIDFECFKCDFKCLKKGDWNRHLLTQKHKYEPNEPEVTSLVAEKGNYNTCICGQIFNSRTTTWRHKKKCNKIPQENAENNMTMTITEKEPSPTNLTEDMIMKLLNQNSELIKLLETQMSKNVLTNNNNVVVNNNNNNTFNLNIYLNETCSEALNLNEFVNLLEVKLNDLEETAKIGYTQGVSRIFINGLNSLEEKKRPIHCSDLKREVLYIKNNDEWKKEDEGKTALLNAIKNVSRKNIRQISEWQKKYPEFKDIESKENEMYQKMLCGAMGGSTDEEQNNNLSKIIRNITRSVVIEKCGISGGRSVAEVWHKCDRSGVISAVYNGIKNVYNKDV